MNRPEKKPKLRRTKEHSKNLNRNQQPYSMKNNSTDIKTQLILTMGGRGGVGKTVALVAIADYLQTKGYKFFCTDCDTENAGKFSSFAHWFKDTAVRLNLRNVADCDNA